MEEVVAVPRKVVEEGQILMEAVVGLRCNHLVGPKAEAPGIHSRPVVGNRIQGLLVLRLEPKVGRLEAQVACHRMTAVGSRSCFHRRDRRRKPKVQRRHSSLDVEDSIHPVLQQQEDHAPKA